MENSEIIPPERIHAELRAYADKANAKRIEHYAKRHGLNPDEVDPNAAGLALNHIPQTLTPNLRQRLREAGDSKVLNIRVNPLLLAQAQAKARMETEAREAFYGEGVTGNRITVAHVVKDFLEHYVNTDLGGAITVNPMTPPPMPPA